MSFDGRWYVGQRALGNGCDPSSNIELVVVSMRSCGGGFHHGRVVKWGLFARICLPKGGQPYNVSKFGGVIAIGKVIGARPREPLSENSKPIPSLNPCSGRRRRRRPCRRMSARRRKRFAPVAYGGQPVSAIEKPPRSRGGSPPWFYDRNERIRAVILGLFTNSPRAAAEETAFVCHGVRRADRPVAGGYSTRSSLVALTSTLDRVKTFPCSKQASDN